MYQILSFFVIILTEKFKQKNFGVIKLIYTPHEDVLMTTVNDST